MRFFTVLLLCFVPFIAARPSPASGAPQAVAEVTEYRQHFLDRMTTYFTAAYDLMQVIPVTAKEAIKSLEAPPITDLVTVLNHQLHRAGLEPSNQNITNLNLLAEAAGNLTLGDIGGYLEYRAGDLAGATIVPNNVTQYTLTQCVAIAKANHLLRRRWH